MRKIKTTPGLLALTMVTLVLGACTETTGTPRDPGNKYLPEAQIVRPIPVGGAGGDTGMQGMAGAPPPAMMPAAPPAAAPPAPPASM